MHPDRTIDWTIPSTPPGWAGRLERFMGPGKSRAESLVEAIGGVTVFTVIFAASARDESIRDWSSIQIGLGVVLTLDLVGGVLTNATNSAKRWYHRPGPGRRRARLIFVATHTLHLAIMAFVLLPDGQRWWWTNVVLLAVSVLVIEAVPIEIKRPTAMAAFMCALAIGQTIAPTTGVLSLVAPLFYLKLLIGHMVPEAPMTDRRTFDPSRTSG